MSKDKSPSGGFPVGNQDPNKRGRGGDPIIGQPGKDGKIKGPGPKKEK